MSVYSLQQKKVCSDMLCRKQITKKHSSCDVVSGDLWLHLIVVKVGRFEYHVLFLVKTTNVLSKFKKKKSLTQLFHVSSTYNCSHWGCSRFCYYVSLIWENIKTWKVLETT